MTDRPDLESEALLDALRESESPSSAQLDAGLERLNAAIGTPPPPATSAASASTGITKIVAGVAFVATAVGVGWLALGPADEEPIATATASPDPEPEPEPEPEPVLDPVLDPEPEPDPDPEPEPDPAPEPAPDLDPDPGVDPEPDVAKKKQKKPKSDAGDLEAELALLQSAAAALAEGDPKRALKRVDAHRRRFPKSALVDERELLRARALCDSGDAAGARKVANRVLKKRPNSHLAGRLRAVCQ